MTLLHLLRIDAHVHAQHLKLAFVSRHQAGRQPYERRLARSVRAHQGREGSVLDGQRHFVQRRHRFAACATEALLYPESYESRHGFVSSH